MKVAQLKTLIKEAVREAIREELALNEVKTPQQAPPAPSMPQKDLSPLNEMLNQTRESMGREEYKQVMGFDSSQAQGFAGNTPTMGQQPGLDLSQLDFAKKAGAIYQKSNEIDKAKHGL